MWTSVPMREARYTRRPNTATSRSTLTDTNNKVVHPSSEITNSVADQQLLKREIRIVKKVAAALEKEAWVIALLSSIKGHLHSMIGALRLSASTADSSKELQAEATAEKCPSDKRTVCIKFVGLGIGTFTCGTCPSALLQMGLFLAIKNMLMGFAVSSGQMQYESAAHVISECFDPVASFCDTEVCREFGIAMPHHNCYGAYELADNGTDFMIAFMPHCSATLYHNLYAANWPQHRCDAPLHLSPWERILLIGNDLSRYTSNPQVARNRKNCIPSLLPAMTIEPSFHEKSRNRKSDGGVAGVTSFSDVERAFSDLTVVTIRSSDVGRAVADQGRGNFKLLTDGLDIL